DLMLIVNADPHLALWAAAELVFSRSENQPGVLPSVPNHVECNVHGRTGPYSGWPNDPAQQRRPRWEPFLQEERASRPRSAAAPGSALPSYQERLGTSMGYTACERSNGPKVIAKRAVGTAASGNSTQVPGQTLLMHRNDPRATMPETSHIHHT